MMLVEFHLCLHLALGVPVGCFLQLLCSRTREPMRRGKEEGWWLVHLPVHAEEKERRDCTTSLQINDISGVDSLFSHSETG